jgi:hypothetical protein
MDAQRRIQTVIYLTVFVLTGLLYLHHDDLQAQTLKYASSVASIVLGIVFLFEFWLWRIPLLEGWLVKRPSIAGTWRVTLQSNWVDPETGKQIGPIEGYMVVRQSFSTLTMRQLTAESSSELLGTEIVCSADGLYCVSGVYRNEPNYDVRNRSQIHYGALWLRIEDAHSSVSGHYWTDRNSAGTLKLTGRRLGAKKSFEAARAYLDGPPPDWLQRLFGR